MDDAVLVGRFECDRDLRGDGQGFRQRQTGRAIGPGEMIGERLPVHELHRQRLDAARFLHAEQGRDVGVAQ